MTTPELVAGLMLAALVLYALLAGADFGGGVWDLLASGPRAQAQRDSIAGAIAPMWEANHVWLILIVVMLFTGFPTAYAVASTALHLPLTLMLFGVVLRGSAFVFRQYGPKVATQHRRWGRVFALASVWTPIFLGVTLGAITSGDIRVADGRATTGFFTWVGVFPFAVGGFTLCLFAFLAAVYLTNEVRDAALRDDFRRRALAAGVAVGVMAALAALTAGPGTLHFREALLGSWWSWPLQLATGGAALGAFVALWRRRYPWARACAIAQVTLILGGWAAAQRPYLIAPDVTLASAAAPAGTLRLLLIALALGAGVLFPSLYFLFKVFKVQR